MNFFFRIFNIKNLGNRLRWMTTNNWSTLWYKVNILNQIYRIAINQNSIFTLITDDSIGLIFLLLFFNVCWEDFFDENERVREIREKIFNNDEDDNHFAVLFEDISSKMK